MKKYIIESISTFRHIHVVEAENEDEAFEITKEADENWQEYLGPVKLDVQEFTEEHVKRFREKQFWWDGVAYRNEDGVVEYKHPKNILGESKN